MCIPTLIYPCLARYHRMIIIQGIKQQPLAAQQPSLILFRRIFSPLIKNVDVWHQKVTPKATIDYGFHMNITRFDKELKNEIPLLIKEGITSLKVFTAYNKRFAIK